MSSLQMQAMQAGEISSHACEIPGPKGLSAKPFFRLGGLLAWPVQALLENTL